jgi:hypothetical protein
VKHLTAIRRVGLTMALSAFTLSAAALFAGRLRQWVAPVTISGGIGAISAGISEFLVEVVLFSTIAVGLNLALAPRARLWGAAATRLRYLHLVLTAVLPFVPSAAVVFPGAQALLGGAALIRLWKDPRS